MFVQELRQGTAQKIRVGVLIAAPSKFEEPVIPVTGAELSWYYWKYLIKADDSVVNIGTRTWVDITGCAGLYYLTLTADDTEYLGQLTLYIHDAVSLAKPIFMYFQVVNQNCYDAKYGNKLLKVEPEAQGE